MNRLVAKSRFPEDKKPLPASRMQEYRDRALPGLRIMELKYTGDQPQLLKKLKVAHKGENR